MNNLEIYNGNYSVAGMYGEDIKFSYKILDYIDVEYSHHKDRFGNEFTYARTQEDTISEAEFVEEIKQSNIPYYKVAAASGMLCSILQEPLAKLIDSTNNKITDLIDKQKQSLEENERFKHLLKMLNIFVPKEEITQSHLIELLLSKVNLWNDDILDELMSGKLKEFEGIEQDASAIGLLACILEQFKGVKISVCYDEKKGLYIKTTNKKFKGNKHYIGKDPAEKIMFAVITWFLECVKHSDYLTVEQITNAGIPVEVANLIIAFKDHKLEEMDVYATSEQIANSFGLNKFRLGNEIKVDTEFLSEIMPVVLNDAIVRSFYMVMMVKKQLTGEGMIHDLSSMDWKACIPTTKDNRVLTRMLTISSSVFMATDFAKATIAVNITKNPKQFIQSINIAGVGRFIIAVAVDGEYLKQDIREMFEEHHKYQEIKKTDAFDVDDPESNLKFEQNRVLWSLVYQMVRRDAREEKKQEYKQLKEEWLDTWLSEQETEFNKCKNQLPGVTFDSFIIIDEDEFYDYIRELKKNDDSPKDTQTWMCTVVLGAITYKPYTLTVSMDENDLKKYKKLKYNKNAYIPTFCTRQSMVIEKEVKDLNKLYDVYYARISGKTNRAVLGFGAAAVATVATGGICAACAPAIATAIVGGSATATGLSGAALTSHCLATLGGGALAAGGAGMAGGTAVIAGGGALVGLAGSTLTLNAAAIDIMNEKALDSWCKYLALSKYIYVDKYHNYAPLERLDKALNDAKKKIQNETRITSDHLKYKDYLMANDATEAKKQEKELKDRLKSLKCSLKYITGTKAEVKKLLS